MIIIFFVFGLIVGSFLNAVIYRLHKEESFVKGRSRCPKCGHKLNFKDLIPIFSFIFLKGKCRYCHKKISWQYPILELAGGILFSLVYFFQPAEISCLAGSYCSVIYLARNLFFTSFLILIFAYDFKYYLILPKVTFPAMAVALAFNLILGFSILKLLLAAAVLAGFFGLQFLVSRGKWIGGGDIHFGALIGLMLGWPVALVALVLGYFFGGVVGIFLLVTKKKSLKSELPLATFLAAGALIALLWGDLILSWYLRLTF